MSRVPKLHIHVIGAKCLTLRGKDVRSGTAVPEVFTVMEFGKEKFATRSVQCSKSCTWNEDAAFSMSLPTDEKRYVILKVLQKNPKVMSLEDDLFVGQIAVPLSEFLTTWDPSDSIIKKNNYPLTSKHGKTNKDRGFLEFKISFQNVGKQESAYQVPAFQLANKEGSVAGGSSVGNATPESQSQTSGTLNKFDKNDRFLKAAENDFKYGKSTASSGYGSVQKISNSSGEDGEIIRTHQPIISSNQQPPTEGNLKRSSSMRKLWNTKGLGALKKKMVNKFSASTNNLTLVGENECLGGCKITNKKN